MHIKFQHLRGIIIEGISTSGKTTLLNTIKKVSARIPERSFIILGEHYSQLQHKRNGQIEFSTQEEHKELIKKNLDMLINLGKWSNYLGSYKKESRGLFYVFERFHLNHKQHFQQSDIEDIEFNLINCNAKTVLLILSKEELEKRIQQRNTELSKNALMKEVEKLDLIQNQLIDLSKKSKIPTQIIKTDDMNWLAYANSCIGIN